MEIKVLSLFDGISVAQQALKELGYTPKYYASEIDAHAIAITQKNHPETIQLGSVKNVAGDIKTENPQYIFTHDMDGIKSHHTGGIDILIGGSPCQDLSSAKNFRKGLKGDKSSLFYEYVRILQETKPKYFVLENVASMPRRDRDTITKLLGVEPILLDAVLVSAQRRRRLFWTNIPNLEQPNDVGICVGDILQKYNREPLIKLPGGDHETRYTKNGYHKCRPDAKKSSIQGTHVFYKAGKTAALTTGHTPMVDIEGTVSKLTITECERLQNLPDEYTAGVNKTQRLKMLGNSFNKEIVKHILKNIEL